MQSELLLMCPLLILMSYYNTRSCYGLLKLEKKQAPKIFEDLPKRADLALYLKTIKTLLDSSFHIRYRRQASDIGFAFGLFVTRVHLKRVIKDNQNLSEDMLNFLYNLLDDAKSLMTFNDKMLQEEKDSLMYEENYVTIKMSDEAYWKDHVTNLSVLSLRPLAINDTLGVYSAWARYNDLVTYSKNKGGLEFSYKCITFLVNYYNSNKPTNKEQRLPSCKSLPNTCYLLLVGGKYYGYVLNLRLYILLYSKYTYRCNLISQETDNDILQDLCAYSFKEATFIGQNRHKNQEVLHLWLNQINFCLLNGNAIFLNRKWIQDLLSYQTRFGCFDLDVNKLGVNVMIHRYINRTDPEWWLKRNRLYFELGGCNAHITGGVAAILGAAVRFILETYY